MEYVAFHDTYTDIPVQEIVTAWEATYGRQRVQGWIKDFEEHGRLMGRNFDREEIIKK